MTSSAFSRVPLKPLYNTSIKLLISPISMLYLQKVLLIHLKKCIFYIIYESEILNKLIFECKNQFFGVSLEVMSTKN